MKLFRFVAAVVVVLMAALRAWRESNGPITPTELVAVVEAPMPQPAVAATAQLQQVAHSDSDGFDRREVGAGNRAATLEAARQE
jgi:hypothetical protein